MLAALVELILQPQALLIRLDRADRLRDAVDPRLRLELAELTCRRGAFARVVIGAGRLPPDAGVQPTGQHHTSHLAPPDQRGLRQRASERCNTYARDQQ